MSDAWEIARAAHEVQRAYRESVGDVTVLPWTNLTHWRRAALVDKVAYFLEHPKAPPSREDMAVDQDSITAEFLFRAVVKVLR